MADATEPWYASWNDMAARNGGIGFVDICLRGAGQVIFQNNPLTGLFFLLAIVWGAIAAGQIAIAIGAIVALVVSTYTAILLDVDEASLKQGLFGFNGVLVGAAVPTFLASEPAMWFVLLIGAAVSTVVMLAVSNVMKTWGAPALTFPFVLTTWFIMLAAYSFGRVAITGLSPPSLPHPPGSTGFDLSALELLRTWLRGPAQVFLINNVISGILVVIGLAVSSRFAAVFALAGSALAILIAILFGASASSVSAGLYGFSPVLTAVGLGCVFYAPSWRVTIYALLGTIFTVIVQGALDAAFGPLGIPTFTAPFVFVTWLFLLPKADLKPHPHLPIQGGVIRGHAPSTPPASKSSTS